MYIMQGPDDDNDPNYIPRKISCNPTYNLTRGKTYYIYGVSEKNDGQQYKGIFDHKAVTISGVKTMTYFFNDVVTITGPDNISILKKIASINGPDNISTFKNFATIKFWKFCQVETTEKKGGLRKRKRKTKKNKTKRNKSKKMKTRRR